jgi:hypothetical protein
MRALIKPYIQITTIGAVGGLGIVCFKNQSLTPPKEEVMGALFISPFWPITIPLCMLIVPYQFITGNNVIFIVKIEPSAQDKD